MSRYTPPHNSVPIVAAALAWSEKALVADGSVFSEEAIWTRTHLDALEQYVVKRPDTGEGGFNEKLEAQVADAPPGARKLMAELLWVLFLFPSNITEETKRSSVVRAWSWSGDSLDADHPLLGDDVLDGIGSAGMGINSNRWREVNYVISLAHTFKQLAPQARRDVLADYDRFMEWIETVPMEGERQFRHMLRFFLFPDRVERFSSNGDRRRVLAGFGVAPVKVSRKWSDRKLDDEILALRRMQEEKYGTSELDFYVSPLKEVWQDPGAPPDDVLEEPQDDENAKISEPEAAGYRTAGLAKNLIFYGPPGTGKTHRLRRMFDEYTDQPADIDRTAWERHLVSGYGWRPVITAALADLEDGQAAKVAKVENHPLVKAKAAQRNLPGAVSNLVWTYLREHSAAEGTGVRRPPHIFERDGNSCWSLKKGWATEDPEAAELSRRWHVGPARSDLPVRRFRVVTFHPSYSYEDFVIGLRPIQLDEAGSGVQFQMVDGVFKQACAEARADPARRYALFIDEINRADIAKVFGELITLIEPDKRGRYDEAGRLVSGMEVQLPGTGGSDGYPERFCVPHNLDIFGTMNTADRSIALLDIALRRRFEFVEMAPDYTVIDRRVDGVDLGRLLRRINNRIEYLADRDRAIGHAYLVGVGSLDELRRVFLSRVIPLLQEYFFDDLSRVEMVLSDTNGQSAFIAREPLEGARLFSGQDEMDRRFRYRVTETEAWRSEDFIGIYADS